ncbi:hypothetical protein [Nucisporomicrobium flavum]|uniref:hypothetical protein n=1 Tax=Nucisporomicrobium flavum TaxID=2785915 RepID=UPI0018F6E918|nr:hypothetical protein [Nucisporomicrobium flavum]
MSDRISMRGRDWLSAVLRVTAAVAVTLACWFGAANAFLAAILQIHPWAGEAERRELVVVYLLLTVVALMAPAVAWRFLVPATRWWSAAVLAVIALVALGLGVAVVVR